MLEEMGPQDQLLLECEPLFCFSIDSQLRILKENNMSDWDSFIFNAIDGSLHIEGYPTTIQSGLDRDLAASAFSKLYHTAIDHKNGYEWLAFQGVSFGGYPCSFSLGFHLGRLEQIHWGVALPNAEMEGGWSTREAIDAEIMFVRRILSDAFARGFSSGQEHFEWGCVWCVFDAKGFQASSGLRYAAKPGAQPAPLSLNAAR